VSGKPSGRPRVAVIGAAGRMGTRLVRLLGEHAGLELGAALDKGTDPAAALAGMSVVIDFSAPAACAEIAPLCAAGGVAYVVGSTGLSAAHLQALDAASRRIPVLQAANFSLGVNVLMELARTAATRLGEGVEVGIHDVHHRHKRDAPSGTALALETAIKAGRQSASVVHSAQRGGDVAGDHTITFFADGERLELTHRASTPDIFARGALTAALWLVGKPAGRYTMADVLRGA
jgi:4-hydroxy-tetrahydrodipicolinate reductase